MADTKISEFTPAATLSLLNRVPILQTAGANHTATIGQIVNLAVAATQVVTTSDAIPVAVSSDVVLVSGMVSLASGTVVGKKLTIVATAPGTITLAVTSGTVSYTFVGGSTLSLLWANSTWNILSIFNMTLV